MKKFFTMMMALIMLVCPTSVAFAAEENETITPYSTGVIYEYQNNNLTDASVRTFKASMGGKLRLAFAGIPTDGNAAGKITVTIEVKNWQGNYVERYTYSFNANKEMNIKTPEGVYLLNGDECKLIISKSGTNKTMIVAGYVGVYD